MGHRHTCVLGVATVNRSAHPAHDRCHCLSRRKPTVEISLYHSNTLDSANSHDITPLTFPHVGLGMVQSERFNFDDNVAGRGFWTGDRLNLQLLGATKLLSDN